MHDLTISIPLLAVIFTFVAFFYASVGLGGGSSYTALLAIFGAGAAVIPMVTLSLNILVTTIGSIVFLVNKHARLRLIGPFLISSIPMAYVGGMLHLPKIIFFIVLLVSLIFASIRIYFPSKTKKYVVDGKKKILIALFCGALLGLVAGIAGIGGGIYLIPIILILGLGNEKEAAASATFFIWVNSLAGFISRIQFNRIDLIPYFPLFFGVVLGGFAGSVMGAGYLKPRTMNKILGCVILVAIFFLSRKIVLLSLN